VGDAEELRAAVRPGVVMHRHPQGGAALTDLHIISTQMQLVVSRVVPARK
jgi:hypothetical protein